MKSIVLLALAAFVAAAPDIAEFRRILNKSRADCRRDRTPKANINRVCTGRTLADLYVQIPNGEATVRAYAPPDFRKTLDMCHSRQSGESSDWQQLRLARAKLGVAPNTDQWKECDAQMRLEQEDCKNAQTLVCAFTQGTAFECASPSQLNRKANTILNDQCFLFDAYQSGRPQTVAEFNKRIADSRTDCRRASSSDTISTRCLKERTVAELLRQLPPNVNWKAHIRPTSDLGKSVDMCLQREEVGWPAMRAKVNRVLRGGGANVAARRQCMDQLQKEQTQCMDTSKILCAFTYGLSMDCVDSNQQQTNTPRGQCDAVLLALDVDDI